MRKVVFCICLALALAGPSMFSCMVQGQPMERKPGVNVGDWIFYGDYSFSWNANVPLSELGSDVQTFIKAYSEIVSWKVSVLEVSGSLVKYQLTWHFRNGTDFSMQTYMDGRLINASFVDVSTGSYSNMIFIAANLSAGDSIYTDYPDWIIGETVHMQYLGCRREVNVLFKAGNYTIGDSLYIFNFNLVWDRLTGILLEWHASTEIRKGTKTVSYVVDLKTTGTNRWKAKTVLVEVDFSPETLNLNSRGRWISAYIELPKGYRARDINVSTLMLNNAVPAETHRGLSRCGRTMTVKFDRAEVVSYILDNIDSMTRLNHNKWVLELTITGTLYDGTPFQGSSKVRIILERARACW